MNVFDLFKQILNDDGGNTFPFLSSSTLLPSVSEMTTSSIQPTTSTTTTTTMLPSTSMTMRKSIQPHVPDVSISTTTMVPSSPTSIQPVPMRKSSTQHDHDTNMLPTPISSSVSISTSNTLKEEFPLPKRRRGSTNHDFNTVLEFQCLECDFHTQDREIIREHCKRGNQA